MIAIANEEEIYEIDKTHTQKIKSISIGSSFQTLFSKLADNFW